MPLQTYYKYNNFFFLNYAFPKREKLLEKYLFHALPPLLPNIYLPHAPEWRSLAWKELHIIKLEKYEKNFIYKGVLERHIMVYRGSDTAICHLYFH